MGDSNTNRDSQTDPFRNFLLEQNHTWKLSADNYRGLAFVEEKAFDINGFKIKVQFNPQRIRSSAAKVDQKSIAARACFLCGENRPAEQNSLELGHDFLLLVNPFPIFKRHFTLPSIHHTDQRLAGNLTAMLDLARKMEGYTLFYNGPECGASAPDHLHFQAGEAGFLPVESELEQLKQTAGSRLVDTDRLKVWAFDRYLRKMITFETSDPESGVGAVEQLLARFAEMQPEKVEPMVNLLCYFEAGTWTIHLFPRKLHRPKQYFAQGEGQLLISPASVDFGGVFITPRKEDFDKITPADVVDIFSQVTLDEETFERLRNKLRVES